MIMKIIKSNCLVLLLFTGFLVAQTEIISEEYMILNDSIQLPGTLSYDKALETQPLVIYIHGSGGVDRNGNQGSMMQPNYIKQLSEALNNRGIAFYRYDKRTSNMSNVKFLMKGIEITDFKEDLEYAIDKFKDDSRFSSITLIGHSQGSLIGMLASKVNVDKYISLAGPAESFDTTLVRQIRELNGDEAANKLQQHFTELKNTGDIKNLDPELATLFNPINKKFFNSYNNYVPTQEIKKVTIPTLIINGTNDSQITVEDAKALHNSKPDAEIKIIDKMNHVLKIIESMDDNEDALLKPDFPLSMKLVEAIEVFIKK
jgi:uncharacterized protein